MKRHMQTRYLFSKILPTLFLLCLTYKDSHGWFSISGNCENCLVFESPQSAEQVTKTYAFLPNSPNTDSSVRLHDAFPKSSSQPSAGELQIDIPFNMLSASTTNVQALLDRQVAANLRLKKLLEQYLAQQKKNAKILQDLKIPYLEITQLQKQAEPTPDTKKLQPADELKRKIAEEITFQTGVMDRRELQDTPNFKSILTEKNGSGNSMPDLERYEKTNIDHAHSKNRRKIDSHHRNNSQDTELPWIFTFGLRLLRFLANNKIEILFWAAGMAVIGLVGTIVVKR